MYVWQRQAYIGSNNEELKSKLLLSNSVSELTARSGDVQKKSKTE
ncbi:hypothetical protein PP707_08350 [Acetobacter pasteurianus]|nr:hypothetical protein [Acetobacter pasteurianus]